MNLKRILPYLLLNVLVSAVTTFAILWWWQQKHPVQPTIVVLPTADAAAAVTPEALKPTSAVTAAALEVPEKGKKVVEIQNVFGAEDLKTEVVRIKYLGGNELPLTGWTLSGGSGAIIRFQNLHSIRMGRSMFSPEPVPIPPLNCIAV
jgi:hypothetical protein